MKTKETYIQELIETIRQEPCRKCDLHFRKAGTAWGERNCRKCEEMYRREAELIYERFIEPLTSLVRFQTEAEADFG